MCRLTKMLLLSALILASIARFQSLSQTNTGRIVGTVTDESGALIPGVVVMVRNPTTGFSRGVVTNESGTFTVPLLPPAVYEVEATLPGFRPELRSGITLQVDAVLRLDFELHVGSIADKVEVMADAPLVQNETASLGQVMDSRKVTDIPLNQRHFMTLTVLTTGVMPVVQGSNLSSQNLSFEANGGRERDNNFLLDGVDNNDPGNGQLNIVPSVDAIQEFKISTTNYGAELGRAGGGVLNVQTKSGANDYRAVFFEFLRNNAFDARNFFAPTKPPYKRNQFGTVLSGPIKKDRAFFMFNYEGNRIRQTDTALATVPSVKQQAGDFSEASKALIDPLTGQAFPGNVIPPDRIDRLGAAMAAYYPAPNRGITGPTSNNYLSTAKGLWNFDIITSRVDYRVSDKQSIFGRFTWQDSYQVDTGFSKGTQLPNYGTVYFQPIGRNVALSDTYVFGPNVVNEARIGFNRLIGGLFGQYYQRDIAKELGLPGVQSEINPAVGQYTSYGLPTINVTGLSAIGGTSAQIRYDNTWHFFDMLAVTQGNHQMKMGGEFRTLMFMFNSGGGSPNGSFTFDGRYSGNPFADMLLGYAAQTSRAIGDAHSHSHDRQGGLFFQDDWKVTRNLTMNLGVRWEVMTPYTDADDAMAVFDPGTGQIVIGGKSGPQTFRNPIYPDRTITVPGGADLGIPAGLYFTDRNNIAPRFGFAYSPKVAKIVVRGGFGIFTTPEIPNPQYSYRNSSYPWVIPQTFIGDSKTPNVTLADPFPDALGNTSITARALDRNWRNGYMEQWNLGIQHPIGTDMVIDIAYAGSAGKKLQGSRDINQPQPGPGSVASRRPFPSFGSIVQNERSISSNYHSMQVKFERRFSRGLSLVSAYTWSHSIDYQSPNSTGSGGTQNNYNLRAERGNSPWDIRHRLVNSYSYQLPIGSKKRFFSGASGPVGTLISGWQVAGITTLSTGQSFTPIVSGDIAGIGATSVRPNRVADGTLPREQRTPAHWFDTSAFTIPAAGTFGNAGRNILKAPGTTNWDLTLMKSTALGEQHRVEFRVEFFNAFNHAAFNIPNATVNSPSFGTLFSSNPARQVQFGLKLYY
jgi:hypothetical protein